MKKIFSEKNIHSIFEVSVVLKGIHAVLEVVVGIWALFITKAFLISTVLSLTQEELTEDPKDFIANYFITIANNISISAKYFFVFYLLIYGIIRLLLIIGLLRKKLWAYPASIAVFSIFIIYQLYRYFHTFSISLLLLTILDLVIIFLTVHEYRFIKSHELNKIQLA